MLDIKIIRIKIRNYRLIKGYSQEYMSSELNISQTAYHKIESGKIKLKVCTLLKIADVLEINPLSLFTN
ncbi:helix-turn-helix domain-containing protein [Polaribacter sp.]|uniref:helix-turn-helix domain-containing protein n=1 Tax=Polaribacter sp. TaxID=1920175 RepID=UPI0040484FE4